MSLKDLVEERKSRLEQQYWLYQLNREVDELEQWIAQREVVASSPELGQDFEHVTVSVSADGVDALDAIFMSVTQSPDVEAKLGLFFFYCNLQQIYQFN